jgi:hypothetical protein
LITVLLGARVTLDDVVSCAAAGDAAKSNAEINPSFFISTRLCLEASQ